MRYQLVRYLAADEPGATDVIAGESRAAERKPMAPLTGCTGARSGQARSVRARRVQLHPVGLEYTIVAVTCSLL